MSSKRRRDGGSSYTRNGADQVRGVRNNGYLSFANSPIGVGASRLAYRCRVQGGCYRGYTEGSYCIFKVFKPEARFRDVGDVSYTDVEMQVRARRYAEDFNRACRPQRHGEPCNITIRDAALGSFSSDRTLYDDDGDSFCVYEGAPFLLEREIRGHFEKFSSNSGWISGDDPILEAFSHWSWVNSGQEHLVCDLQGHKGDGSLPHLGHDYYYLLTDPAICSADREFGESDLGQAGINSFFRNHTCNEWCRHLDIEYETPSYTSCHVATRRSTSRDLCPWTSACPP